MKKIFILLLLAAISFGIYYSYEGFFKKRVFKDYSASSELRDSALKDLMISTTGDTYSAAFYITAKWVSEIKTNPETSSVKMEIIITQTESAKGKVVINSASMKGVTAPGQNNGSLSCRISNKDITPERPYAWVKISSVINGKPQPPIIKSLGKFNN